MKNKTSLTSKIYMALIFIFLYAPIIVMMVFSFNSSSSTYQLNGFSTYWWGEMFRDSSAMSALKNTVILAVTTAFLSTIIGILGISMMLLFVFVGALFKKTQVLGFATLLIAHVTFCLPYVILNVMPKLRQFDMNVYEAAVDLGCKPLKAFVKVVLPDIMSGIITGCVMSFTLSLDDFIISYFTNGPSFQTLPIYIFSLTKKRVKPDMFALSTLMFVVILVLLVLMNVAQARAEKREANK
jgi:spermidine/putrescine transport system permease protein